MAGCIARCQNYTHMLTRAERANGFTARAQHVRRLLHSLIPVIPSGARQAALSPNRTNTCTAEGAPWRYRRGCCPCLLPSLVTRGWNFVRGGPQARIQIGWTLCRIHRWLLATQEGGATQLHLHRKDHPKISLETWFSKTLDRQEQTSGLGFWILRSSERYLRP
jgi:hypothetical protein